MKRLVFVLCFYFLGLLLILTSPVWAENWYVIGASASGTSTIRVDKSSITRKGNLSTAWFKQHFRDSNIDLYTYTTYNCTSKVFLVLEMYVVRPNGERVSIETGGATWKVFHDPVDEMSRNAICR